MEDDKWLIYEEDDEFGFDQEGAGTKCSEVDLKLVLVVGFCLS